MDDLTREELEQLFAVFRDQSLQLLEEMSQDLLLLEACGPEGEVLARLKRAAHTIKGDSACVGLSGVTEITHRVEDLIEAIAAASSAGNSSVERGVIDLIFESLDHVKASVMSDEMQDVSADDLALLIAKVSDFTSSEHRHTEPEASAPKREAGAAKEAPPREAKAALRQGGAKGRKDYIRVEAARIDALLNLAGEMVIARSMMNQVGPELEAAIQAKDLADRFGRASAQMGKLIAELQKSVLKMRMVTIDQLFKRFARPMRELAAEHGKLVELDITGGETELDRTLVDLLYEPLLHLLRNAVDHGIEKAEQRQAAGKPAAGALRLRAYHEGNQVVVEVADDGRGVDLQALKAKAVESGLIGKSEVERMADDEACELMFLQGVSTAKSITRISGRGVGAYAVKSAVEQLRGSINVKSERGAGTTFIVRMPLTLAIIKGLLFKSCGRSFALPLLSVSEIARAKRADVVRLEGFESFRLRDKFISLIRPGVVFGFDRRKGGSGSALRGASEHLYIIVLAVGNKRFGVVADSIIGEQELVIKPLDGEWVQNDALAGASVLGDGSVVLIMDAGMVFRKAVRFERSNGNGKEAYAV